MGQQPGYVDNRELLNINYIFVGMLLLSFFLSPPIVSRILGPLSFLRHSNLLPLRQQDGVNSSQVVF